LPCQAKSVTQKIALGDNRGIGRKRGGILDPRVFRGKVLGELGT